MNRDNNNTIKDLNLELFLLFIDEERNKDLEKRFVTYINKYSNFDKIDKLDNSDNQYFKYKKRKGSKNKPKVIKFVLC